MLKESFVKSVYGKNFAAHGFDHVERVHSKGMQIAKTEKKVNLRALDAALWLHDIARDKESETGLCHAEEGAKMVVPILKKLKFSEEEIKIVSNAIASHRFRAGKKAESIEAKILQDADRLDAIGAISIGRIFAYGGHHGRPLYDAKNPTKPDSNTSIGHFYHKQLKLKPQGFHTSLAKKLAKKRYNFIKLFLKNFHEEIK